MVTVNEIVLHLKGLALGLASNEKVRLVLISSDGKDTHSPVLTMWPHSFLLLAVIQFILGACYAGLGTIESLAERDVCLRCYYVFSIRIYIQMNRT